VVLALVLRPKPAADAARTADGRAPAPERLSTPDALEGAPSLTVQSDPPGATVYIQGEDAGRTPLLGSNEFARGAQVEVRMELRGYRPWTGNFVGGTNATVRAKLLRK
jgi:PEGA domain-containing protein